ncbi:hypothetical protein C8R44DRAFT_739003 [Mycena epipterygia]|nr:hypothetical protein C8R44DRAFT_739003 [Mycena epipterygia]
MDFTEWEPSVNHEDGILATRGIECDECRELLRSSRDTGNLPDRARSGCRLAEQNSVVARCTTGNELAPAVIREEAKASSTIVTAPEVALVGGVRAMPVLYAPRIVWCEYCAIIGQNLSPQSQRRKYLPHSGSMSTIMNLSARSKDRQRTEVTGSRDVRILLLRGNLEYFGEDRSLNISSGKFKSKGRSSSAHSWKLTTVGAKYPLSPRSNPRKEFGLGRLLISFGSREIGDWQGHRRPDRRRVAGSTPQACARKTRCLVPVGVQKAEIAKMGSNAQANECGIWETSAQIERVDGLLPRIIQRVVVAMIFAAGLVSREQQYQDIGGFIWRGKKNHMNPGPWHLY